MQPLARHAYMKMVQCDCRIAVQVSPLASPAPADISVCGFQENVLVPALAATTFLCVLVQFSNSFFFFFFCLLLLVMSCRFYSYQSCISGGTRRQQRINHEAVCRRHQNRVIHMPQAGAHAIELDDVIRCGRRYSRKLPIVGNSHLRLWSGMA